MRNVFIPIVANSADTYEMLTSVSALFVKPVLSGHSKIDKTKILMTNGR